MDQLLQWRLLLMPVMLLPACSLMAGTLAGKHGMPALHTHAWVPALLLLCLPHLLPLL